MQKLILALALIGIASAAVATELDWDNCTKRAPCFKQCPKGDQQCTDVSYILQKCEQGDEYKDFQAWLTAASGDDKMPDVYFSYHKKCDPQVKDSSVIADMQACYLKCADPGSSSGSDSSSSVILSLSIICSVIFFMI